MALDPTKITPPTPGDDDEPGFGPLKADPATWRMVRDYAAKRVKGLAAQLGTAQAEAAGLRQHVAALGDPTAVGQAMADAELLRASATALVDAELQGLPEPLRALCPPSLGPAERLSWWAQNGAQLRALAGAPAATAPRLAGRPFMDHPLRPAPLERPDSAAAGAARLASHMKAGGRR